jgi:hypothetical protein
MMKTMEKLMEIMSLGNKPPCREKNDPHPRNHNPRRGLLAQIRQREQRDQGNQQIRSSFQKNYADEYFDQMFKDQMHCCDNKDMHVFLTKGEHDQYMIKNDDIMMEMDDMLSWETNKFKKGYNDVIMQFQKKYNLRRKKESMEPQQTNPIKEPQ